MSQQKFKYIVCENCKESFNSQEKYTYTSSFLTCNECDYRNPYPIASGGPLIGVGIFTMLILPSIIKLLFVEMDGGSYSYLERTVFSTPGYTLFTIAIWIAGIYFIQKGVSQWSFMQKLEKEMPDWKTRLHNTRNSQ